MTHFVRLENGVPLPGVLIEQNIRQVVPALALSLMFTPELVEPHGYGIYDFSSQPALGRYEKAVEVTPVRDERGIWMQTWSAEPMSAEEMLEVDQLQSARVRNQRSFRLMQTDWTQLADAPLTPEQKSAWSAYRQQLRDVPAQPGFPWDVTWPDAPNENQ